MAIQLGLALAAAHMPWWGILLAAYVLGGPVNISLFVLAHECTHGLVFKKDFWNRYLYTFTTLPMFLSAHHSWWAEHLVHHSETGAQKDFITRRQAFFLITRRTSPLVVPYSAMMLVMQAVRSVAGLVLYLLTDLPRGRLEPSRRTLTVLADEHLVSGYEKDHITKWAVVYPVLCFALYGLLYWYGGWGPLAYLFLAQVFFTGFLHPYCLGWVLWISHVHGHNREQPTVSHYGKLNNFVGFNGGLHVEHHDLAGIPWSRLPKIRRMAPAFYDNLATLPSFTGLALRFVLADRKSFENFDTGAYRNLDAYQEKVLGTETNGGQM